jgi:hypothetical protein
MFKETRGMTRGWWMLALALLAAPIATASAEAAAAAAAEAAPLAAACQVKAVDFHGWKAHEIANAWVRLTIVPQLGGRLMQVTFGDHDFLFVNDQLKGQYFPPETSLAQRKWFNYGGDKIWPMPEGEEDEQHWASAVGAVLDSGQFTLDVLSRQGATCTVRLTGPPDPQVGLQYIREITLTADSPEIRFRATMKNSTGYPVRWSEQSVSQYNASDRKNANDYNHELWGIVPAHPQSTFLNGYHVRTGSASNPSYSIRDGQFAVHFGNIGGEVWIDSPGPWLAVVDGATNHTMIERFHYQREAEYPGKSTIIFYTTGPERRTPPPAERPPDAPPPIHYMEAEINSPMIELAPGESYTMETEWLPTRMGREFKTATWAGVIGDPLTADRSPDGLVLAGRFGVFFAGRLIARFYDRDGLATGSAKLPEVNPLEPVALQATVPAPAETVRVSVHLIDGHGVDRGPLGEARVKEKDKETQGGRPQ